VGSLIGYARVSTADQSADLQTDELTAAGCLSLDPLMILGGERRV